MNQNRNEIDPKNLNRNKDCTSFQESTLSCLKPRDEIGPAHDKSQMKGLIKSKVRVDVSSVVLRQCYLTI